MSDEFSVNVATPMGRRVTIGGLKSRTRVGELRRRAKREANIVDPGSERDSPWSLMYGNQTLRGNMSLGQYGIQNNANLRLVKSMKVIVETKEGRVTISQIKPDTRVDEVLRDAVRESNSGQAPPGSYWQLMYNGDVLDNDRIIAAYGISNGSVLLLDAGAGQASELIVNLQLTGDLDDELSSRVKKLGYIKLTPDMLYGAGGRMLLYEPGVVVTKSILEDIAPGDTPSAALTEQMTWSKLVRRMRTRRITRDMQSPSTINFILKTFFPEKTGKIRLNNRTYVIRSRGRGREDNGLPSPMLPTKKMTQSGVHYEITISLRVVRERTINKPLGLFRANCADRARQMREDFAFLRDPVQAKQKELAIEISKHQALSTTRRRARARKQYFQLAMADKRSLTQIARERAQARSKKRAIQKSAASDTIYRVPQSGRLIHQKRLQDVHDEMGKRNTPRARGGSSRRLRGRTRSKARRRKHHSAIRRRSRRNPAARGSGMKRKSTRRRFRA